MRLHSKIMHITLVEVLVSRELLQIHFTHGITRCGHFESTFSEDRKLEDCDGYEI